MVGNSTTSSEFGKGLVICLVKFAEHYERLIRTLEDYAQRQKEKAGGLDWPEQNALEIYFNGVSDHLYEIEVPKEWEQKYPHLCQMVGELQNTGLRWGHGFMGEKITKEQAYNLHQLARDIALEIDKILGLTPDIGEW